MPTAQFFYFKETATPETSTPYVTKRETLVASAHLPHFDENLYRDEDDDVWLIPTAEPQLVSLHRDETVPFDKLPLRYVAYTPCFRREHMSAGRDVRGIKRGHQFDKVEMVVYTTPEASRQMLDELTARAGPRQPRQLDRPRRRAGRPRARGRGRCAPHPRRPRRDRSGPDRRAGAAACAAVGVDRSGQHRSVPRHGRSPDALLRSRDGG